jgi:hypothetical protein
MTNLVTSARREAVRLALAEPMAPAVRRLGERPTAARMVRRRLFPERQLVLDQPVWPFKKFRRAS